MSFEYATLVYLNRHKEMLGAAGLAAAVAHPSTRRAGVTASVWAGRHLVAPAVYHSGMAAAVPAKNILYLIGPYAARATGAVAVGALIGSTVGMGVSRAVWGKSGQQHAVDLYTGKVSFQTWSQAVSDLPRYLLGTK